MKESKLIEMRNQIDTLGKVAMKMTKDYQALQMIVMGDHEVIKQLSEFPEIIKTMQKQQEDAKQENTDGSTTGDSGLIDTAK